ncbi:MAG TPA: intradiol ring-cleavage dioxygenase [Phycisphaerae bacterium]|nr:intradiol ring-cleavage dioxygenase [Phycisphaerae bacterium]HRW51845.1 intradiol ring-cleavage dioxygenase [Phycisphaerae bacterium]
MSKNDEAPKDGVSRRRMLQAGGLFALGAGVEGCNVNLQRLANGLTTGSNSNTNTGTSATSGSVGNVDCVLTPELTEGPYYIDVDLLRTDITEGKAGVPLALTATIVEANTCEPIPDVVFEIWHADAEGSYSGFQSEGTRGETFLRGAQITDTNGKATIQTIYPGWYQGRAVHIHAKVHLSSQSVVTTQFFFSDDLTDEVYANNAPYNQRGQRSTLNASDGIFPNDNDVVLNVESDGNGGYTASITIGVA